jgi:hypothetical protein
MLRRIVIAAVGGTAAFSRPPKRPTGALAALPHYW